MARKKAPAKPKRKPPKLMKPKKPKAHNLPRIVNPNKPSPKPKPRVRKKRS